MGLEAHGLVKTFRHRRVVNDVNVSIDRGEVVGLLGPNGRARRRPSTWSSARSRRTAAASCSTAETSPTCPCARRCRQGIGYLPQESSIFRKLTVEENLLVIPETIDLNPRERRSDAMLRELSLEHLAKQRDFTLSGGERRRLEITRCLITAPNYILLDEPFTGIDPIAIAEIQSIVARLKEKGIGVLITDHNVRETLSITDRSYILYGGQILVSGKAHELATNEKAREIYLGEKFSL
jgi:lipopolysaccharide export system ATP-binding protein